MKSILMILPLSAITLIAGPLFSEALPSSVVASDDEYAEEALQLDGSGSTESVLARAARIGASVVISSGEDEGAVYTSVEEKPAVYTVQDGDTLWDISDRYFGDPYVWPRVWSYNPTVTNPNWIYPGDLLYLTPKSPAAPPAAMKSAAVPVGAGTVPGMPRDSILVRSRGFVDTEALKKSGEIVGSNKAVMWLSQYDETYVEFPEASVKVGDRVSAFAILREVDPIDDEGTELGKIVEIKGLLRVVSFDAETKIARVAVEEAISPIKRGTLVGPVHRFLDVVPAVANEKEVKGNIVAFLDMGTLAATHHIVFVDRGAEEGVKEGNRFFAVEARDGLRRIDDEPDDREGFPTEVLAELRVVETRPHTSTCLITSSVRELEVGQKVEMRKGY